MKTKIYNGCCCKVNYNNKKELFGGTCARCGQEFCGKHIYSYVDGNNIAITKHSKNYCEKCYRKVYEL